MKHLIRKSILHHQVFHLLAIVVCLVLATSYLSLPVLAATQITLTVRPGQDSIEFTAANTLRIQYHASDNHDLYYCIRDVGSAEPVKSAISEGGISFTSGGQGFSYLIEQTFTNAAKIVSFFGKANLESVPDVEDSPVYSVLVPAYNDTTPPNVAACALANQDLTAGTADLVITFDEVMLIGATHEQVDVGSQGTVTVSPNITQGSFSWSADQMTLTIPVSGLTYGQTYNVTIDGFKDPGNYDDNGKVFVPNIMAQAHQTQVTTQNAPPPSTATPTQITPLTHTVTAGAGGSVQLSADGNPTPEFAASGQPSGVSLGASGLLAVDSTVPVGTYPFDVTATNSAGSVTKTFTLTVSEQGSLIFNPYYDAVLTIDGDYSKLTDIFLNGVRLTQTPTGSGVDLSGYPGYPYVLGNAGPGSVKVTLYKEFLQTLANGSYTLSVSFNDGSSGGLPFQIQWPTGNQIPNPPSYTYSSSDSGSSGSGGSTYTPPPKTQLPASAFSWNSPRLTIDNDAITTLGLTKVLWDGVETNAYKVYKGSVIIKFDADFLAQQKPGKHTVRVEFLNHYGEYEIDLSETGAVTQTPVSTSGAAPVNANANPSTGR